MSRSSMVSVVGSWQRYLIVPTLIQLRLLRPGVMAMTPRQRYQPRSRVMLMRPRQRYWKLCRHGSGSMLWRPLGPAIRTTTPRRRPTLIRPRPGGVVLRPQQRTTLIQPQSGVMVMRSQRRMPPPSLTTRPGGISDADATSALRGPLANTYASRRMHRSHRNPDAREDFER